MIILSICKHFSISVHVFQLHVWRPQQSTLESLPPLHTRTVFITFSLQHPCNSSWYFYWDTLHSPPCLPQAKTKSACYVPILQWKMEKRIFLQYFLSEVQSAMYQSIQHPTTKLYVWKNKFLLLTLVKIIKKALHAYNMKIDNQESAFNIYYLYKKNK